MPIESAPERKRFTARRARTGIDGRGQARDRSERAFARAQDIARGDGIGAFRKHVTARFAAAADEQSRAGKRADDGLGIFDGDLLPRGKFVYARLYLS